MKEKDIIGIGRTATVYKYEDKVVKLFNNDINHRWIDLELEANQIANEHHGIVPKVYGKIELDGKSGIIFEKITGDTALATLLKDKSKCIYLAKETAKSHYSVHQASVTSLNIENQNDMYLNRVIRSNHIPNDIKAKVSALIKTLPTDNKLCHGDLHIDNLIVNDNGFYIIDWSNVYRGHPLSDVARTYYLMDTPYGRKDASFLLKPFIRLITFVFKKAYLKEYLKLSGFTRHELREFKIPMLASRMIENVPLEKEWLLKLISKSIK